ncbi:MAG: flagellar basal-body rod protein FlgG, partial [Pseudomonadales bacterium]
MNSALWVSKTGLSAQDTALRTISNNLANVGTVGFKKDRAVFEDLVYQINQQPGAQSSQDSTLPSGTQLGTGVRVASTQKQFSIGSIQTTERALDLAIEGSGFFQISMPDGSTGYSRTGSFSINQDGDLVTSQGYTLEPAINVPQGSTGLTIGRDGTVSAVSQGVSSQIGNLQLVNFVNPTGLEAMGGNLYRETVARSEEH